MKREAMKMEQLEAAAAFPKEVWFAIAGFLLLFLLKSYGLV